MSQGALADGGLDLLGGEVGVVGEEARLEVLVDLGDGLDEDLAGDLRVEEELLGDVDEIELGAELVVLELDGLHRDQVDDAAELVLGAEG